MDWTTIATPALQVFSGTLAAILTAVISWALYKYTGIKLDENQQAQAKQIVLGVEDKAISMLKKNQAVPSGAEKHTDAVAQLQVVTGLSKDAAVSQVDRAVGSLPNVGALVTPCPNPMNQP